MANKVKLLIKCDPEKGIRTKIEGSGTELLAAISMLETNVIGVIAKNRNYSIEEALELEAKIHEIVTGQVKEGEHINLCKE